jgi:hypothetical protein
MLGTLVVFTVVFVALVIRYATDYTPEDPLRLWSTRIAVLAIFVWIVTGLSGTFPRGFSSQFLFARYFFRAALAIAVIWFAFRDEL